MRGQISQKEERLSVQPNRHPRFSTYWIITLKVENKKVIEPADDTKLCGKANSTEKKDKNYFIIQIKNKPADEIHC